MKSDLSQSETDRNQTDDALTEPHEPGRVRKNVIANFVGKFWVALLGFAFIPVYIKFLGMEAYGLIGFYMTLQTVFFLLDMGLSTTLNRELARRSVSKNAAQEMRDMARTLEIVYWGAGVIMGVAMVLLSPAIAHYWVKAEELSPDVISKAVMGMGIAMALQFPFSLYQGGLLGLQRQVLLNGVLVLTSSVRYVGAVLVLWKFSPTIQAYFGWQVIASGFASLITGVLLWRSLPPSNSRPAFRAGMLADVWRFAAGMAGISIFAVLLTQMDKVILSKLLTLEMFGYYSLAAMVAGSLAVIVFPLFTALFPRFSQLVALNDEPALTQLYHKGSQLMSVAVLPAAAVVAMFSRELLLAWTGKPLVADRAHLLLSLLVIGWALNGLVTVPYAVQLAHGWTRLGLYTNMVAVALFVPGVWFATREYGAPGAAVVWIALNAGYVLITIQIMHRRLLKREMARWYLADVFLPAVAAFGLAAAGRWLMPQSMPAPLAIVLVAGVYVVSAAAACLTAPYVRAWLLGKAGIGKKPNVGVQKR